MVKNKSPISRIQLAKEGVPEAKHTYTLEMKDIWILEDLWFGISHYTTLTDSKVSSRLSILWTICVNGWSGNILEWVDCGGE